MSLSIPPRILWLDLETTGLDPAHHDVLEIGAIVTDSAMEGQQFAELGRFHQLVQIDRGLPVAELRAKFDEPAWDMHMHNGLLAALLDGQGISARRAWSGLADWLRTGLAMPDGSVPSDDSDVSYVLAGHGVGHMELRWIDSKAPDLWHAVPLVYWQLDPHLMRRTFKLWGWQVADTPPAHRALADCEQAIASMEWMAQALKVGSNRAALRVQPDLAAATDGP